MTCKEICEKHRNTLISWFKLDLFHMWAFLGRRRPELFFCRSSLWIMCAVIYRSFGKDTYLFFFWNWSTKTIPLHSRCNNKAKTDRKRYPLSSSERISITLRWIQMRHHSFIFYLILHTLFVLFMQILSSYI